MGPARIYPSRKMHRSRVPSIAPGTFFVAQSWADGITNMAGFNLRQPHLCRGTGQVEEQRGPHLFGPGDRPAASDDSQEESSRMSRRKPVSSDLRRAVIRTDFVPKIRSAPKDLRRLRTTVFVAQEVGEGLGRGKDLFGALHGRPPSQAERVRARPRAAQART